MFRRTLLALPLATLLAAGAAPKPAAPPAFREGLDALSARLWEVAAARFETALATPGLDPKARVELKHLIRVLAQEGKTIFISSHILSELGEMCDSLLFVNGGRIVHHGDAETLRQGTDALGGMLYDIQVLGDPQAVSDWCVINPHVEFLESRKAGGRIRIESTDSERAAEVLARMIKDGIKVVEFHKEQRNLEDAFMDMLGRLDRGGGALPAAAPKPAQPAFTPPESAN